MKIRLLLLAPILLLAACASGAALESHRDPAVEVGELATFRILPNSYRSSGAPQAVAAAKREIERAIQDTLVSKGYRRADKDNADFDVEYLMYTTEQYQQGLHDRYVFGDSVHLLGGAESTLDNPIREGTLHIHFLRDGKPFFEAIASDVVETGMPVEKRIRATVPQMLADFPVRCCN